MYQQLMPGVYVGVLPESALPESALPVRAFTDAETHAAAREWWSLCASLGLDRQSTARGVVTEIERLRAETIALARLANPPRLDGGPVIYGTPDLCCCCEIEMTPAGEALCAGCRAALNAVEVAYGVSSCG